MKKYIVIALSVGGLGNKIFNSGDTVSESHFDVGHAEKLLEQGFLKPYEISEEGIDAEQERIAKEQVEDKQKADAEKARLEEEKTRKAEEERLLLKELEEQERIAKEQASQDQNDQISKKGK